MTLPACVFPWFPSKMEGNRAPGECMGLSLAPALVVQYSRAVSRGPLELQTQQGLTGQKDSKDRPDVSAGSWATELI